MKAYLDLVQDVLDHGEVRKDRTGTGTKSLFGKQVHYDLREGFPCLTTKKLHLRSIIHELLWFLKGDTNIAYLQTHGVRIWDEWADAEGNLGPVYGKQWRSWATAGGETVDQISQLLHDLKHNPQSRRLVVSAWNVGEVPQMALPPCHLLFQFYVHEPVNEGDRYGLSCQLYQRSADLFLGVPFNIASYALLVHLIAHVMDFEPRSFVHTFGDVHVYLNHLEQANLQLSRAPLPLPTLKLNPAITDLFDFTFEDIEIVNYQSHPAIKAEVSV